MSNVGLSKIAISGNSGGKISKKQPRRNASSQKNKTQLLIH